MSRPASPVEAGSRPDEPNQQVDAATESRVLLLIAFLQAHRGRHHISKNDVFQYCGVRKTTGYRVLRRAERRRESKGEDEPENRGRKPKMTRADLARIEDWIDAQDAEGGTVMWEGLLVAVGIHGVAERTVRNHVQSLDFRRCTACPRSFVSTPVRRKRVEFARYWLARKPRPEDWEDVGFSDEVHVGLGPQKTLRLVHRKGERPCARCVQDKPESPEKKNREEKRFHVWALVGYNVKSEIIFYATDAVGKVTQAAYHLILQTHVLPRAREAKALQRSWRLMEDGDSSHTGRDITKWKRDHGVETIPNAPYSPDLNAIDDAWSPWMQTIRSGADGHVGDPEMVMMKAWKDGVTQESINRWVHSMPERLQRVIDCDGHLTQ